MIHAITLLKTALILLNLVATTPVPQSMKDNAISIANQAIVVATAEIAKSGQVTVQPVQYQPIMNTPVTPQYIAPAPTGSIPLEVPPLFIQSIKKMTTLEIINPADGKGLGRNYVAYNWDEFNKPGIADNERPAGFTFPTEENYIYIGVVCKDESGSPIRNAQVVIEATDATQNKTLDGTGATVKVMDSIGQESRVSFYPFNYQFKTAGDHTINFTCNGVTESVTVTVSDPQ